MTAAFTPNMGALAWRCWLAADSAFFATGGQAMAGATVTGRVEWIRLAPLVVEEIAATIAAMKAAGLAVLLSEQNPRFAKRVADRAALVERGRIVAEGPAEEIAAASQRAAL